MEAKRLASPWMRICPRQAYNRPAIPLLIGLMAGIAAGTHYPDHGVWAWALAVAALALSAFRLGRGQSCLLAPIFLFFSIGYLSIQPWSATATPPHHVARYTGPARWNIVGTVRTRPVIAKHRSRFILSAETLESTGTPVPVTGNVRVTVAGRPADLTPGDRLRISSRLRAPRNFNNPGGFDYRRYLAFRKVKATAFCKESGLFLLESTRTSGMTRVLARTRAAIAGLIDAAISSPSPRGLMKALLLGDRSGIPAGLKEAFNRAGVSHLLAISGLHVGIVAGGAFWLFTRILCFFQPLLWQASARKWAAFLALFPVAFYGFVAGMSPSTQRAVVMVAIFLATFWFGRDQDPINTLAIAAFAILGFHPPDLFSVSFQLSFSAVTMIILGMSRWPAAPGRDAGPVHKMAFKAYAFFGVSALAILGTLPLVALYFNQVSRVGLLTNAIAVPVIGGGVVPLGIFSVLISPLWPAAAVWGLKAGGSLIDLCLPVIETVAKSPLAAIKTITPNTLEIAGYYLLLGAAIHLVKPVRRHRSDRSAGFRKSGSARRAALALTAVTAVFLSVDVGYWIHARFLHENLRATIIDVGQGSATLLEFPKGPVMLVDGGGFSGPNSFDVGARVIAPLLWRKKIRTVDILVLSHPEADHMNGLLYIAEHFEPKQLWMTGDRSDSRAFHRLLEITRKDAIHIPDFKTFPRVHQINGARLEILHPPADFMSSTPGFPRGSRNDNSQVLRVSYGSHSLLLPGDVMARGEALLVDTCGSALRSTVLVSPHHGSRTSSTDAFLERVRPKAVIVSAGYHNRSRHPHPSVLSRYKTLKADTFDTAGDGAVYLEFNVESLRITPFLENSGARVYR